MIKFVISKNKKKIANPKANQQINEKQDISNKTQYLKPTSHPLKSKNHKQNQT